MTGPLGREAALSGTPPPPPPLRALFGLPLPLGCRSVGGYFISFVHFWFLVGLPRICVRGGHYCRSVAGFEASDKGGGGGSNAGVCACVCVQAPREDERRKKIFYAAFSPRTGM